MRKFIFIINAIELLQLLMSGKYVQGVLYIDRETGLLTFKAYNRKPRNQGSDRLVHQLETGWVKESQERYKTYSSVPKDMPLEALVRALGENHEEAVQTIVDVELIERA